MPYIVFNIKPHYKTKQINILWEKIASIPEKKKIGTHLTNIYVLQN